MAHADFFDEHRGPSPSPAVRAGRFIAWLLPLVALAGLLALYLKVTREPPRRPAARGGIADAPPLPPPIDDPAFDAVEDRTSVGFRELPAYKLLLDRLRATEPATLADEARTDVYFADFLKEPERYRGLPIRLQGTARRILPIEDLPPALAGDGRLVEAWTITEDSVIGPKAYPYVLVLDDPPEGMPGGFDVNAFLVFRGFFFKLLAYQAGDTKRAAPMLIGHAEYVPRASGPEPGQAIGGQRAILMALIAALVLFLFARTVLTLKSAIAPSRRHYRLPPRDQISPEELDAFLQGEGDDHPGPDAS